MAGNVKGLSELSKKLIELGASLGSKVLRQAVLQATTPAFKEMKAAIPVGKVAHRTYKGRLVAPGFAKRNVRRKSRVKGGKATATIGVSSEAFYAVSFVDKGTKKMKAKKWFKQTFINQQQAMESALVSLLREKIQKAAR